MTHGETRPELLVQNSILICRWLRNYATSRRVAGSSPDEVTAPPPPINLILADALGPGAYSASNINE
jgi:hypothetical protein